MKAYKVTRTVKQEFISFGNSKEEAINNSYDFDRYDFDLLKNEVNFICQGEVIGGSATAKVINDTVTVRITDGYATNYEYGQRAEMLELINKGANIVEIDNEGVIKRIQLDNE